MAEFNQLLEQIQSVERAQRQLQNVHVQLDTAYKKRTELQKIIDKEYADVEKLEKIGLKDIFYKVLGDKEHQLEQERQEYLQAVLHYKEHKKSIELLAFEQGVLEEKIHQNKHLFAKKDAYLAQLAKQHKESKTPIGQALLQLEKEIEDKYYICREIKEAQVVGKKCTQLLTKMQQHLQAVQHWGHWNIRHQHLVNKKLNLNQIDNAHQLVHQTNYYLAKLEDELADIYGKGRINLTFKSETFKNFTTLFLGNLMVDWVVQQKIHHSVSSINFTKKHVLNICNTIQNEQEQLLVIIKRLEKRRRELTLEMKE